MNAQRRRSIFDRAGAFIAAALFAALAIANVLAAAPSCHDWLHNVGDAKHECAATLISSGNVEHSSCEAALTHPIAVPTARIPSAERCPRVSARLEFTRLEHAPPVFS